MNDQELLQFMQASEHPYECRCKICYQWWDNVGPEMEDDKNHSRGCKCKICRNPLIN
jgi:hypothetical protein